MQTHLQQKTVETIMAEEEIAYNEQYLILQQCLKLYSIITHIPLSTLSNMQTHLQQETFETIMAKEEIAYNEPHTIKCFLTNHHDLKKSCLTNHHDLKKSCLTNHHGLKKSCLTNHHGLKKSCLTNHHGLKKSCLTNHHDLKKFRRVYTCYPRNVSAKLFESRPNTLVGEDF